MRVPFQCDISLLATRGRNLCVGTCLHHILFNSGAVYRRFNFESCQLPRSNEIHGKQWLLSDYSILLLFRDPISMAAINSKDREKKRIGVYCSKTLYRIPFS